MVTLTIGQDVAFRNRYQIFTGYKVSRVTPTGACTIKRECDGYEKKFDKTGLAAPMYPGQQKYNRDILLTDMVAVRLELEETQLRKEAIDCVNKLVPGHFSAGGSKENLTEMLNKVQADLVAARAAVEKMK